ncbi:uncharacterized protein AMSG_02217 [Thecamonas trahens ATCC 50062]|uniref:Uncharacterized protein n=1 Tax=Thecamonas trahens ATCC 50062 TaxID=461836 RepID=A0A0L0DXI5_THETB|nr:hypothetical protein AMSG_02217 [Thecamonas trahens ATCC 50062]KNC56248.1 hypothetical protein AMSG_02217 [Thecamonas trahens ATCC 50062]|eukprot:XP_013760770.1 hypothetical protein AMSG_02217 [Thecamonas trahens ATCC 50062]
MGGFLGSLSKDLRGCVLFFMYRSLHLWTKATRAARTVIPSRSAETVWVRWAFGLRHVAVIASATMTYLTIRADERGDEDEVLRLILWGLIPSGVRTLAAMLTSTLDRIHAKDAQIEALALQPLMLRGAAFSRTHTKSRGRARDALTDRYGFQVSTPLLTQYVSLAKGIEIPLNYIVQKLFLLILVVLFIFPDTLSKSLTRDLNTWSRYIRIATTLLLAPLNQYLGWLRVEAYRQVQVACQAKIAARYGDQLELLRQLRAKTASDTEYGSDSSSSSNDVSKRMTAAEVGG